mmetsp:Transcript_37957/g.122782  ORF Transcript_37957/g.122782 Transcript_37957/m.122782 type:complete len:318 (+) Transcript_37957:455-1408(+)
MLQIGEELDLPELDDARRHVSFVERPLEEESRSDGKLRLALVREHAVPSVDQPWQPLARVFCAGYALPFERAEVGGQQPVRRRKLRPAEALHKGDVHLRVDVAVGRVHRPDDEQVLVEGKRVAARRMPQRDLRAAVLEEEEALAEDVGDRGAVHLVDDEHLELPGGCLAGLGGCPEGGEQLAEIGLGGRWAGGLGARLQRRHVQTAQRDERPRCRSEGLGGADDLRRRGGSGIEDALAFWVEHNYSRERLHPRLRLGDCLLDRLLVRHGARPLHKVLIVVARRELHHLVAPRVAPQQPHGEPHRKACLAAARRARED